MCLLYFKNSATDMDGGENDDSHDIFMGDSWFASVPTEKSIRRSGSRFKGVFKITHHILPKDELESLVHPFPGGTPVVIESVGDNGQKIYSIGTITPQIKSFTYVS